MNQNDWRNLQLFLKKTNLSYLEMKKKEKEFNEELDNEICKYYKFKKKCRLICDNNLKFIGFNTSSPPKKKIKIEIINKPEELSFYSSIKKFLLEFRSNLDLLLKFINVLDGRNEQLIIANVLVHYFFEDITKKEASEIFSEFLAVLIGKELENVDIKLNDGFIKKGSFISKIFDEFTYREEVKVYTKHILLNPIKQLIEKEQEEIKTNKEYKEIFITLNIGKIKKIITEVENLFIKDVKQTEAVFGKAKSNQKNLNNDLFMSQFLNKNNDLKNIEERVFKSENIINIQYLRHKLRSGELNLFQKKFYINQLLYLQNSKDKNIYTNEKFEQLVKNEENYPNIIALYCQNLELIDNYIYEILLSLNDTYYYTPKIIRNISNIINSEILKKFDNINQFDLNNFILYFLIEYIIIPVLQFPEKNEILTKEVLSPNIHKSINTLVYVLRKIYKGEFFSSEFDVYYTPLNKYMENWIFAFHNIINNFINGDKVDDIFEVNYNNEVNDLYQTMCLSKKEIRIFIDKYKKINDLCQKEDNTEYEQLYFNIDSILKENEEENEIEKFYIFTHYNFSEYRNNILKIKLKKEINIEFNYMDLNEDLIVQKQYELVDGIKNCVKHVLINIPNLTFNSKNYAFELLFKEINKNINYHQIKQTYLLNNIPLNWYSKFIDKNMVVLPEEYKKDNFYKLYDEIEKETNDFNYQILNKSTIYTNEMLSEITELKKNTLFYKHQLKEIKKLELNTKIYFFIENSKPEVCLLQRNIYNINYAFKLYNITNKPITQEMINENEKELILSTNDKCIHSIIENLQKTNNEIKKNFGYMKKEGHCQTIDDFITKILFSRHSITEDILNKYLHKGEKNIQNDTKVNKVVESYFEILEKYIETNFNQFFESKNPKKFELKKEEFLVKIQSYIMTKISIKLSSFLKEKFEQKQKNIENLFTDRTFNEKCKRLSKYGDELMNYLEIKKDDINIDCMNIAIDYLSKMDKEKYCNNIIEKFSKAINVIVNMLMFTQEKKESSIDDFLPIIVYLCIMSNPQNMITNFCNCIYFLTNKQSNQNIGFNLANIEGCINYIINLNENNIFNKNYNNE